MSLFGDRKIGKDYVAPKSSVYGIQKASGFRRLAAFLLDVILVCILATGFAAATTSLIKYDDLSGKLNEKYLEYGLASYNEEGNLVHCEIPFQEQGESDEDYLERLKTNDCYNAYVNLNNDDEAIALEAELVRYTFIIITVSVLLSTAIVYLVFPLLFMNGQTLGMKFVQVGLVTNKGIQVNFANVFLRWSMGFFIIDIMIPIYCLIYVLLIGNYISSLRKINEEECIKEEVVPILVKVTCPENETSKETPIDVKGKVIVKKSKRGKVFYGCNNYPKCKTIINKEDRVLLRSGIMPDG